MFCAGEVTNACGGCGPLPVTLGDSCGSCAGNIWECRTLTFEGERAGVECGGVSLNDCGGCEAIAPGERPGTPCGACGTFTCSGTAGTLCSDPGLNECGGCNRPGFALGESCSACGETGAGVCDGTFLTCSSPSLNLCGGCSPLALRPGDSCGACGTVACFGTDSAVCMDPCSP
jgi:hypothetical protein